ncbi:MAG: YggS family pyridoxal phosphate-dependent enzyme [Gammaproteobacteria bacterium]|nr:YggS family pyridoxal phosphate-dependent enzyme [Gammaproteobacteria bacterium]
MTKIAENISSIRQQITQFEVRYKRESSSVKLLAVSKRIGIEKIRTAHGAGQLDFGENYYQEAKDKIDALLELNLYWHFIGPMQSNKTRGIAENFSWVHSVDREKIAVRLNEQRPVGLENLNVCVQVNLSGENSKSGVSLDECAVLCNSIDQLPRLSLRGLMAIPAPLSSFEEQRQCFIALFSKYENLKSLHSSMDTLSLGMSNDFEAAIAEGSTMIRIGTGIFGTRN